MPSDEPSQSVKRILIKAESRLRLVRVGRAVSAWLLAILGLSLVLLLVLRFSYGLLADSGWGFYAPLAAVGVLFLAMLLMVLLFSWKCSVERVLLLDLREFYKQRIAEELDDEEPDDEDLKLLKLHHQYREESLAVTEEYRTKARKYKRWHDWFQTVAIVGSVATSAIATASVNIEEFRVATVVISLVVGISTGVNGYYKFRERYFNLQQASDQIEREYHSVELRVGRYIGRDEADAYKLFAQQVESIRDEQSKRQQQLEQPVEVKKE